MNNKININKLKPFSRFIMTIGEIPSSYLVSMTYEEQLIWLCNYLEKTVIPAINNNAEAFEELQNLFIELKNYVEYYFENLDVQEEINNKLDEMAESGELSEIITAYLNVKSILAYNTKNDMKTATNIIDGSFLRTYGTNAYNDGYGNFYKARQLLNTDVIDDINIIALNDLNLIAELIPDANLTLIENQISAINNTISAINNTLENDNSRIEFASRNNTLTLQRNIIYDSPNAKHIQGLCVAGDFIYVYQVNTTTNGNLLKFNYKNFSYIETIQNLNFGHGNDLIYLTSTNSIYGAKLNSSIDIEVYNLSNNSESTLSPFGDISDLSGYEMYGITKYDDNTLLCAFTNDTVWGNVNILNDKFYLYNLNDYSINELIIENPFNIDFSNIYARQSIELKNNKLYFLMSLENCLIESIIEGNKIKINKLYNLPYYDNDNFPINEYEGISLANDDNFIISTITSNIEGTKYEYKFYKINPYTNLQPYAKQRVIGFNTNRRTITYVGTNTSLYEDGTENFPYKTIFRGCMASQKPFYHVVSVKNGTYNEESSLYNCDCFIYAYDNETPNVNIDVQKVVNSNIGFEQITFGNILFDSSISNQLKCTYNGVVTVTKNSYISAREGFCNVASGTIPWLNEYNSILKTTGITYNNLAQNAIQIQNTYDAISYSGSSASNNNVQILGVGYNFTRGKYTGS